MSGTPKFVYQNRPHQIFPTVNFVFSHDGHLGPGGGGGGWRGAQVLEPAALRFPADGGPSANAQPPVRTLGLTEDCRMPSALLASFPTPAQLSWTAGAILPLGVEDPGTPTPQMSQRLLVNRRLGQRPSAGGLDIQRVPMAPPPSKGPPSIATTRRETLKA